MIGGKLESRAHSLPVLSQTSVLKLLYSEYVARSENVIALGKTGTAKARIAYDFELAACQRRLPVAFPTAAALRTELREALDERLPLHQQRQRAGYTRRSSVGYATCPSGRPALRCRSRF